MKKIEKLGIFDSGLGGYTVYQDLKTHFPNLSMTLYADQKNAPYGNYSDAHITKLAHEAMQWFLDAGISDVLLACNTVTSVSLPELNQSFPQMRIWGIVDLTLSQLPKDTKDVAVFATQATVNAHAYKESFEKSFDGKIYEIPLKNLASAIENLEDKSVIDQMLEAPFNEIKAVSHVILGCTHYPLVIDSFKKYSNATFVDSILPIREFIQNNYLETQGERHIVTTKDKDELEKQIASLYKKKESVEAI